ncbi:MAG: hypothetical protein HY026_02610 [Deltaproteobacteria bacterium]|nr:hypothetical protein [Deltaproteobacteria bacterium]
MKAVFAIIVAFSVYLGLGSAVFAKPVDPVCEKVLPLAEVNKAYTKKKIVLFGQQEQRWATATCNYGHEDDKEPALTLGIAPYISSDKFNKTYKNNPLWKPLTGVGDEAFVSGKLGDMVVAGKGKLVIMLVSYVDLDKKTFKTTPKFSTNQLVEWAKQILARYK